MCTLAEQDYENEIGHPCSSTTKKKQIVTRNDKTCKQCGGKDHEILVAAQQRRTQCNTCFLKSLTHKFRATIGKSKAIRRGDSVLIAHSGKTNSSVLLRLVQDDNNEEIRKKLLLQPKIIYIDDGAVKGRTLEERQTILYLLLKEGQELQLTEDHNSILVISLARCLDENISYDTECLTIKCRDNVVSVDTDGDTELCRIFESLEDDTAREELLRRLKRRLLVLVARKLGCSKVFLADTLTKLAVKVLTDVSTGRGAHLLADVSFSDTRSSDIMLVRPLKDFTDEDITCYMKLNGLTAILDNYQKSSYFPNALRSVADRFVYELDREFHSTVSTIYRTSEKLCDKRTFDLQKGQNSICVLCEVTLDCSSSEYNKNDELSAVQAISLSREISSSLSLSEHTNSEVDHSDRNCRCTNDLHCERPLTLRNFGKYLCHGCALIFFSSERHKPSILPSFVSNAIQERIRLAHMREEINEFIL